MGRALLHLSIVFAEMERGLSGSRPLASTSDGARGSAGNGPKRYRTYAGATASLGVASPR